MTTFFLLKPDGYERKDEIIGKFFSKTGLVSCIDFEMDRGLFDSIYANSVPPEKMDGIFEYLTSGLCTFGESYNSIEELLSLTGRHSMPELCAQGTIRREFGKGVVMSSQGIEIIRNAIHRPKTLIQNSVQSKLIRENLRL
ncbi:MAG: hypothetical protein H6502_01590 [Candidatus Woesearchaeota archaeon]|nr:MAG: hypothetical protein H6502_01590 [Candidatus Woesearchaeota archaeon]